VGGGGGRKTVNRKRKLSAVFLPPIQNPSYMSHVLLLCISFLRVIVVLYLRVTCICRLRHINDSVLSLLKMEGIRLFFYMKLNTPTKRKICCIILMFMGPCIITIFHYMFSKMQRYTVYFIWKLFYMFRVVLPPSIRTQTTVSTATVSSNGVTNTRCCRYNCLHSCWWVVVPLETCRAVSR
jgi:hypothetical protein